MWYCSSEGVRVMLMELAVAVGVLAGMVWGAWALGHDVVLMPVNGLLEHGDMM